MKKTIVNLMLGTVLYFTDDLQGGASETPTPNSSADATTQPDAPAPVKAKRKAKGSKASKAAIADGATVKRIEGKEQCRVVAMTRKGRIIGATPIRNSTADKAKQIVGFQRRSFFGKNGSAPDSIKSAIAGAGDDVRFVLQWLRGGKYVDHKFEKAASE